MNWLEFVENPAMMRDIYESIPALQGIEVFEVTLRPTDQAFSIGMGLQRYADKPLPQWVQVGYNSIRLDLEVMGIEDIHIQGWSVYPRSDVDLSRREDGKIQVKLVARDVDMHVVAHAVRVARLAAYLRYSLPPYRKE